MEEATLIEKLSMFGLGRQEAILYLCLLRQDALTGYEVAKLTGISRSNVYNGLAALVEHGAAYMLEGSSVKYTAVALNEFCENRIRLLQESADELVKNGPQKQIETEGYLTITGYNHICDKIHHMLINAEKRVYFSATPMVLDNWKDEIQTLVRNGKKVVLILEEPGSFDSWDLEVKKQITFYTMTQDMLESDWVNRKKLIRLIIDSEFILTGELEGSNHDNCLYSAQKNFVNVFKDAMRNEISLIRLKGEENGN